MVGTYTNWGLQRGKEKTCPLRSQHATTSYIVNFVKESFKNYALIKAGLFIDCDITRRNITDIWKTDRASVTSFTAWGRLKLRSINHNSYSWSTSSLAGTSLSLEMAHRYSRVQHFIMVQERMGTNSCIINDTSILLAPEQEDWLLPLSGHSQKRHLWTFSRFWASPFHIITYLQQRTTNITDPVTGFVQIDVN